MSINVVPYDPEWPRRFAAERVVLAEALAPWLVDGVHHIGSTAVPGLAAKPIIDMIAGVRDLASAREAIPVLVGLGWAPGRHRPDEAHWFRKPADGDATHALHLTEPGSRLWRERFAFRDALRADDGLRDEYQELKLRLADAHDDVTAYTADKRGLVARVLATAGITLTPRTDLASGLRFAAQPVVSVFVPGTPAVAPDFEFGGTPPAQVQTYSLDRDDPASFPYARVTEYDLVFDELPADLHTYLEDCLRVACAAGDSVAWLGFEGSFHFDNILTEVIAPQIYGVCAPGVEPVVAPDLETLRTPAWLSVISSFRNRL